RSFFPKAASELPLAYLITAADRSTWLQQIRAAEALGYKTCKIKIGRDIAADLQALREIRAASNTNLRLDANQTLTLEQWDTLAAELEGVGVEFVEEPLLPKHSDQAGSSNRLIAWDESLIGLTISDLQARLNQSPCKAVVIKPMLVGGVSQALEIARCANEAGISAIFSHSLHGPVALAICSQLALAFGSQSAQGLAPYPSLEAWPLRVVPDYVKSGSICKSSVPGIGELQWDQS